MRTTRQQSTNPIFDSPAGDGDGRTGKRLWARRFDNQCMTRPSYDTVLERVLPQTSVSQTKRIDSFFRLSNFASKSKFCMNIIYKMIIKVETYWIAEVSSAVKSLRSARSAKLTCSSTPRDRTFSSIAKCG